MACYRARPNASARYTDGVNMAPLWDALWAVRTEP